METESEKKSYDIKQAEEANEPKTESYEPISEDSALLEKEKPEPEEKPVESTDETTALTEKANVDPENLTKKEPSSAQTLKGRLLGLFERKKAPSSNGEAPAAVEAQQNGDTPHTPAAEPPQTTTTTKKLFLRPIKLKQRFMKKSESSTPIAPEEHTENAEPAGETDQKDGKEASEVPAAENCGEKKGESKKKYWPYRICFLLFLCEVKKLTENCYYTHS